jgi:hypothetical protein
MPFVFLMKEARCEDIQATLPNSDQGNFIWSSVELTEDLDLCLNRGSLIAGQLLALGHTIAEVRTKTRSVILFGIDGKVDAGVLCIYNRSVGVFFAVGDADLASNILRTFEQSWTRYKTISGGK